ncbi:MAG: glycerol-3-phosphate acyltransferase [Atopobiaceae bacterium]|nr:glycerol-3-phosphate acyltransferase [Atopobiaceae bacterium]
MWRLACLLIGYALGNLLFADIIARLRFRSSIFELGNGNPGMANVARSLGRNAAIACLAGDILKVVAAVLVCRALFPGELPLLVRGWACIGVTLGHDFPVWHGFRGGKGVTTLSSALVLIDWRGALVAALVAAAAVYLTGYLSIAAVAAAGVFVIWAALLLPAEAILLAALVFALALYGQWSNLRGIGDGTAKRDLKRR